MRILIDTNIIISGLFFHGLPKQLLSEFDEKFNVCVNEKIVSEYNKQIERKISNPKYSLNEELRDKFLNCAIDAKGI